MWDTFRSSPPLLTLIAPDRERDLIRSLIDIYEHSGYMPDARSGNDSGRTQGGSHANLMVADAFVKRIKGIDYAMAYQAMLKDASVPPADAQKEGRRGLLHSNSKGYVTLADERSGARAQWNTPMTTSRSQKSYHPFDARVFAKRADNGQNLRDKNLMREGSRPSASSQS